MKNIIYFFIGLILIVFNGSMINFIDLGIVNIRPDLLFLYVAFLALFIGSERASIIGLVLGMILDIYLGRYLGFEGLSLFLTGMLFGFFKDIIFKDKFGGAVILLVAGVAMKNIFSLIFYYNGSFQPLKEGLRLTYLMGLNVFIGIALYYPIKNLVKKLEGGN